jgi:hypothetical protein
MNQIPILSHVILDEDEYERLRVADRLLRMMDEHGLEVVAEDRGANGKVYGVLGTHTSSPIAGSPSQALRYVAMKLGALDTHGRVIDGEGSD